jgi:hypothetical protein
MMSVSGGLLTDGRRTDFTCCYYQLFFDDTKSKPWSFVLEDEFENVVFLSCDYILETTARLAATHLIRGYC